MPIVHHSGPRRLPSNQRAIDPAKRALQDLAAHQQRKYEAAFFVNPIEVVLYTRLQGGLHCACTFNDVSAGPDAAPAGSMLGADGKATPETLQTILTGNKFGISEYASNIGTRSYLPQRNSSERNAFEDELAAGTETQPDLDALDEELPDDADTNENASSQLDRPLRSTDNRSCPICFGSGYVGGYAIHKGVRLVYDMRHPSLTFSSAELEAIHIPNKLEITTKGYGELAVTLPRHVVSIDAFRAMRGKFAADNMLLRARRSNSQTFVSLNSIDAIKSICDGTEWIIRMEPASKLKETEVTHLEIQLNVSDTPLVCEFPRLGENSDTNLIEKLSDIQINFPSSVVSLHSEDVITDGFVGKHWLVSASQVMQDHTRNILGWDCNASVLQPYSVQNILPVRLNIQHSRQKNLTPIRITR